MPGMKWSWLFILMLAFTGCLNSCSSSSEPQVAGSQSSPGASGRGLAAPLDILHEVSVAPGLSNALGRDYESSLPSARVSVEGTSLRFSPAGSDFNGAAFATYAYQLELSDLVGRIGMHWSVKPQAQNLTVGIANWESNRWDWIALDPEDKKNDVSSLGFSNEEAHRSADGVVLVTIVITGNEDAVLEYTSEGIYLPQPSAPRISGTTCDGGPSNTDIDIALFGNWWEPTSFTWDFGGGATPDPATSTDGHALITLGAEGIYPAQVTATNEFGSATYDFDLKVIPAEDWTTTLRIDTDWGQSLEALDCDASGNVYAAWHSTESNAKKTVLAKLDSSGQLLWAKSLSQSEALTPLNLRCLANGDVALAFSADVLTDQGDFMALAYFHGDGALINSFSSSAATVPLAAFDPAGNAMVIAHSGISAFAPDASLRWALTLKNGSKNVAPLAVAVSESGDVFVAGKWEKISPDATDRSAFVAHVDAAGNLVWASHGSTGAYWIRALGCTADGVALLWQPTVKDDGTDKVYLASFTGAGSLAFENGYLSDYDGVCHGAIAASGSSIFLLTHLTSQCAYPGILLPTLLEIDANGSELSRRDFGAPLFDIHDLHLADAGSGAVLLGTGSYSPYISYEDCPAPSAPTSNSYVSADLTVLPYAGTSSPYLLQVTDESVVSGNASNDESPLVMKLVD